jgi:hypothetical protein
MYYTYLFFGIWLALSLVILIHIVPLDATASEPWFYASMVGVLGMVGVIFSTWRVTFNSQYALLLAVIIISVLGVRTFMRGFDWRSDYRLEMSSIHNSKEDYVAYLDVAQDLLAKGQLKQAAVYDQRSIDIFPIEFNYSDLGVILTDEDNFSGALQAYQRSLQYGQAYLTYEDIGALTLFSSAYTTDRAFLLHALILYPRDSNLWLYLALLEDRNNDSVDAKAAITKAAMYGQIPSGLYAGIMQNQSFAIKIVGENVQIYRTHCISPPPQIDQ